MPCDGFNPGGCPLGSIAHSDHSRIRSRVNCICSSGCRTGHEVLARESKRERRALPVGTIPDDGRAHKSEGQYPQLPGAHGHHKERLPERSRQASSQRYLHAWRDGQVCRGQASQLLEHPWVDHFGWLRRGRHRSPSQEPRLAERTRSCGARRRQTSVLSSELFPNCCRESREGRSAGLGTHVASRSARGRLHWLQLAVAAEKEDATTLECPGKVPETFFAGASTSRHGHLDVAQRLLSQAAGQRWARESAEQKRHGG